MVMMMIMLIMMMMKMMMTSLMNFECFFLAKRGFNIFALFFNLAIL